MRGENRHPDDRERTDRMMICGRCGALAALGSSPPLCSRCAAAMPPLATVPSIAKPGAPRRPPRDDARGDPVAPWNVGDLAGILGCFASSFLLLAFLFMFLAGASSPGPSSPGERLATVTTLALGVVGLVFAIGILRGRERSLLGNAVVEGIATMWSAFALVLLLLAEERSDVASIAVGLALVLIAGASSLFSIEALRRRRPGAWRR